MSHLEINMRYTIGLLLIFALCASANAQFSPALHVHVGVGPMIPLKEFPNHKHLGGGTEGGMDATMPIAGRFGLIAGGNYMKRNVEPPEVDDIWARVSGGNIKMFRLGLTFDPVRVPGVEVFLAPALVRLKVDAPDGTTASEVEKSPMNSLGLTAGGSFSVALGSSAAMTLVAEATHAWWNRAELDRRANVGVAEGWYHAYKTSPSLIPVVHLGFQVKNPTKSWMWKRNDPAAHVPKGTSPDTVMVQVRRALERAVAQNVRTGHFSDGPVEVKTRRSENGVIAHAYHRGLSSSSCVFWTGDVPAKKRPETRKFHYISRVPDRVLCDWDQFKP